MQQCEELTGEPIPEDHYILPTPLVTPVLSAYPTQDVFSLTGEPGAVQTPTAHPQTLEARQLGTWEIAAITGSSVFAVAAGVILCVACKKLRCVCSNNDGVNLEQCRL
jgi:hypothetical protein